MASKVKHIMYIVSSFNVLGCELEDGMEDISFLQMDGVFTNKEDAEAFAYEMFLQEKNDPENGYEYDRSERLNDVNAAIVTYYLSSTEFDVDFRLTDLNGRVINVREVKVNPRFVPVKPQ